MEEDGLHLYSFTTETLVNESELQFFYEDKWIFVWTLILSLVLESS